MGERLDSWIKGNGFVYMYVYVRRPDWIIKTINSKHLAN